MVFAFATSQLPVVGDRKTESFLWGEEEYEPEAAAAATAASSLLVVVVVVRAKSSLAERTKRLALSVPRVKPCISSHCLFGLLTTRMSKQSAMATRVITNGFVTWPTEPSSVSVTVSFTNKFT
jgi:hypothetical protein